MRSLDQCGLSESTQEQLRSVFMRYPSVKEVVLYGSRAMGSFKPGSDIDLTIKAQAISMTELFEIENAIDDLMLPYKVDISIFSQIENPNLIDHIQRVGISFYNSNENA